MQYKPTMVIERLPADGGYNATPADPDTHMAEHALDGWILVSTAVTDTRDAGGTEITTHFFWERDNSVTLG